MKMAERESTKYRVQLHHPVKGPAFGRFFWFIAYDLMILSK
jgi:hypothetical protein